MLAEEHRLNFVLMGEILNSFELKIYMSVQKIVDDHHSTKLKNRFISEIVLVFRSIYLVITLHRLVMLILQQVMLFV